MIFYEDPEEQKGSIGMRIFRYLMLGWAMFVATAGVVLMILLIMFPPAHAIYTSFTDDECDRSAPYGASLEVGDAKLVRVLGDRGDLSVRGRPGLSDVVVTGQICTTREQARHIDRIVFTTSHNNDEILVSVELPREPSGELIRDVRMDLVIEVPQGFPRVEIENEIGPVFVSDVRTLQASVGFGSIDATGIGGDVAVPGLEGSVALVDIDGDVDITAIDGYGQVDLAGIAGSVSIGANRSGPARISDIGGNVVIGNAGTGHLTVNRVAGDLSVDRNQRGRISVDEIDGAVKLPQEPGT